MNYTYAISSNSISSQTSWNTLVQILKIIELEIRFILSETKSGIS